MILLLFFIKRTWAVLRIEVSGGFAVGFGQDHGALAVGVGADLFGFGGAGRTQLVGHALPARPSCGRTPSVDLLDVVDALEAHVDDADADLLGFGTTLRSAAASRAALRRRSLRARCAW
jgi:hypothetical protein